MSQAQIINNIIDNWRSQNKIQMVKNLLVFKVPPLIIQSPRLLKRGNSQQRSSAKRQRNFKKFTCGFKQEMQRNIKDEKQTIPNTNHFGNLMLNKSFKQTSQQQQSLNMQTYGSFTKTTPIHRYDEIQQKLIQNKKQNPNLQPIYGSYQQKKVNRPEKEIEKLKMKAEEIVRKQIQTVRKLVMKIEKVKRLLKDLVFLCLKQKNYFRDNFKQWSKPLRLIQPSKILHKGYLPYDPQVRSFWEKKSPNLKNKPNPNGKLGIQISARAYIVVDYRHMVELSSRNSQVYIEIASLTKIMTCYLCILACRKYQINMDSYLIRVTDRAAQMNGTSAQLQPGDLISIKSLLYGLMLPSGNDASVALAEGIGRVIDKYKSNGGNFCVKDKSGYQTFIAQMNYLARELQIEQQYNNSSGLSFNPNFSTPLAIASLSIVAMRNQIFRQIVNTKEVQVQIRNQRYGLFRKVVWKNTNKLLWKGWEGVKTGTTETAGHCLLGLKKNHIVGVFDCETLSKRFTQCTKIYDKLIGKNEEELQKS